MKLRHLIYPTIGLLLGACSTGSESVVPGIGSLAVSLEMQSTMITPDGKPSATEIPYLPSSEEVTLTLSAIDGDYSHTWTDFSQFPQAEEYFVGEYTITALAGVEGMEGYDCPSFKGTAETYVRQGERTDAVVNLTPLVAFIDGRITSKTSDGVTIEQLDIHTPGGVYHSVDTEAAPDSYLCLRPGETSVYATLSSNGEDPLRVEVMNLTTIAGALYPLTASVSDGILKVSCGGKDREIVLTDDFFSEMAPDLEGTWNGIMTIPEGDISDIPLVADIDCGGRPLAHLNLSLASHSLSTLPGFTPQVDLLNLTPQQREFLISNGLEFDVTDDGGQVDFTKFVSGLMFLTQSTATSVMTLEAVDIAGISARPLPLVIETTPVEIEVTGSESALIGVNKAVVHISCGAPGFASHVDIEVFNSVTGLYERVPVTVVSTGNGTYDVEFTVPEGSSPVDVNVLYCNEVRANVVIERSQPEFTIEVDAFASTAGVRIIPQDPSLTAVITSEVDIYINGHEAPTYQRFPEDGIVAIIGLSPSTSYTFTATMMSGVTDKTFTLPVSVRTESTKQLPNADFEERENGIIYPGLPSGGRYSQTTVEIFNWQHHTTFETESPEGWATTNDKTFCRKSSNHNTWYMQPSVILTRKAAVSNAYSALLTSVGFDPDGEEIEDYVQTGTPYLDYSPIVPNIKYRAAGKLFLGSYSFNSKTMEETYKEGIGWSTRPRSLNGFYRFLPPAADRSASGLVIVELTGMVDGVETAIAHNEVRLPLASDFTAFNVPLTYSRFGVKATGIKVMFSSSSECGTIAEETARIVTDSDPVTATSIGGRLWIDNITLAY